MSKRKKASEKYPRKAESRTPVPWELCFHVPAGVVLIAVAAFIVYLPCITGEFVMDDDLLLTNNSLVRSQDGLCQFWCTNEAPEYYPAAYTTFWIEWRLWGMNPAGYHVTNLILHVVESLLIWLVLRKLSIPGAILAALIFAVHPVNVESVAWIAQRRNIMAMLFFLLSILWYLKAVMPTSSVGMAPARSHGGPWERDTAHCPQSTAHCFSWYWLSLAAFVLAMLGKGSAAVLPALLLGIIWWLQPQGTGPIFEGSMRARSAKMGLSPFIRRHLLQTAPFFAVAAALTAVNVWFQTRGTEVVARSANFTERLLGAGGAIWFYLYKALLPINLAFVYSQWHIKAGNPLWWPPLFAALIVTAVLWRDRTGWSRPLLFAWGCFCVALAPVLGFADVGFMRFSLVADHYQHIAIIGVVALAAASWSTWQKHAQGGAHWAANAIAIMAVAALMFLTWRQSELYRDATTLYQDTLEKNPGCWMAQNNLGIALEIAGRPQLAIGYYRQALLLKPDFPDAHTNLGNALFGTGRLQESIEHFKQALLLNPNHAPAHNNLGAILVQAGRPQEAVEHYKQALKLKPDFPEVYNNLGNLMYGKGQMQDAIKYFRKALSFRSDYSEAQYNLGNALVQDGRPQEAIEHYRQSMQLKPNQPVVHYSLGIALMQIDQPREAAEQFRQALLFQPDYIEAYFNLALAYAKTDQPADAAAMAQKALGIARSKGEKEYIKEIEEWLDSYRAGMTK
jgi:tetratricopeptide (TPR) repeat protein